MKNYAVSILFGLGVAISVDARVVRLEIIGREPVTPVAGIAYETIHGRAHGEVDPKDPQDALIQDIDLAPKNARGMVEYVSDFVLIKPVDLRQANGLLFYGVPNRGNVPAFDAAFQARGYV